MTVAAEPPALRFAFTLRVEVAAAEDRGTADGRRHRFVPITGGTVAGPRLCGAVVPGGGDRQVIHPDGLTELEARYALRADDGTAITVINPGIGVASPEVSAQLARGEPVDPAAYYFRSSPRFAVADGPHGWLQRTVFLGVGIRCPDEVVLDIFAVG